jgi:hypothetical protein
MSEAREEAEEDSNLGRFPGPMACVRRELDSLDDLLASRPIRSPRGLLKGMSSAGACSCTEVGELGLLPTKNIRDRLDTNGSGTRMVANLVVIALL